MSARAQERLPSTIARALQGIVAPIVPAWRRRGLPEEPLRLAATRILLRLLVVRRAESSGLLPADDPLYRPSYSLSELHVRLARDRLAQATRLAGRGYAWARLLALFQLVYRGSDHPALPIRAYGGELFEPGEADSRNPVLAALAALQENGPDDAGVLEVLDRLVECERVAGGPDAPAARVIGLLYEELQEWRLDFSPGYAAAVQDRSRRKGSGSFYTPPDLAREVVLSTLRPLMHDVQGGLLPPERLLALRVCDPAMGSGSFLTAALLALSEALARSAKEHGRFRPAHSGPGGCAATVVDLGNGLCLELPGNPGEACLDEAFRVRVRRLVVESCLWGVDLDPVAVELARTALWLETLDRRLPLTFLDHKLVVGDALVGCTLEDLHVYPLSAWSGEPFSARVAAEARSVLLELTSPPLPLPGVEPPERIRQRLSSCLNELRAIPIEFPDRKRQAYRTRVLADPQARDLRDRMDRWCSLWFRSGPPGTDRPGPRGWLRGGTTGGGRAEQAGDEPRFLHWELAFPDVFEGDEPGFDAIVGNPPWEVLRLRPDRKRLSRWFAGRSCPGGPLDVRWRSILGVPAASGNAPFSHQGPGDHNTYRLFLEQGWHLVRSGGRLGFLVPGGLAGDRGAAPLRRLFLDQGRWERLVTFDNRSRLFPVDCRLKFCAAIVGKGGRTSSVDVSFGNESTRPAPGTTWPREMLERYSSHLEFPELSDADELSLFSALHARALPLQRWSLGSRPARYFRELDAGNREGHIAPRVRWETLGARPVAVAPQPADRSLDSALLALPDGLLLPVVHGASVYPHSLFAAAPADGASPRDFVPARSGWRGPSRGLKIAVRRITNATNTRTLIAAPVPDLPCTDKAAVLSLADPAEMLVLAALLNSFALDFVARRICAGTNLDRHHLLRLPMPRPEQLPPERAGQLSLLALRLGCCEPLFAPLWLHLLDSHPELASRPWRAWWAVTPASRAALGVEADRLAATAYGLSTHDMERLLADCGHPADRLADRAFAAGLPRKGFWRVDRERPPELRQTELVRCLYLHEPEPHRFGATPGPPPLPNGRRGAISGPSAPFPEWAQSLVPGLGPLLAGWQEELDAAEDWALCRSVAARLEAHGMRLLPERKTLL